MTKQEALRWAIIFLCYSDNSGSFEVKEKNGAPDLEHLFVCDSGDHDANELDYGIVDHNAMPPLRISIGWEYKKEVYDQPIKSDNSTIIGSEKLNIPTNRAREMVYTILKMIQEADECGYDVSKHPYNKIGFTQPIIEV